MFDPVVFDVAAFRASAAQATKLLRVLANERRLMILRWLTDGERPAGALAPLVGLSQSALSQHLSLLREEGVLTTRRDGQTVWYRIADPAAVRVIATLAAIFCPPQTRPLP